MDSCVSVDKKGGVTSALGRCEASSGKTKLLVVSSLHGAVATQVAANSATALSLFVEQVFLSSVMMVLTRAEALRPEAMHFA